MGVLQRCSGANLSRAWQPANARSKDPSATAAAVDMPPIGRTDATNTHRRHAHGGVIPWYIP